MPRAAKKRNVETVDLTSETDDEAFAPTAGPSSQPMKHAKREPTAPPGTSSQSSKKSRYSVPAPSSSSSQAQGQTRLDIPTPPSSNVGRHDESWLDLEEELDDETMVNSSQDFDDNVYQTLELYGRIQHKVVGVRFYNGRATLGERVMLRREPTNQVCSRFSNPPKRS